jgi:hypothetical protein
MATRASGQRCEASFCNREVRDSMRLRSEEVLGNVDMGESVLKKVIELPVFQAISSSSSSNSGSGALLLLAAQKANLVALSFVLWFRCIVQVSFTKPKAPFTSLPRGSGRSGAFRVAA